MSSHSAVTEHLPGKTQELHLSNPFFTIAGESSESLVLKTKFIYIMRLTTMHWYTGKEQTIFSKITVLYEFSIIP